MLHSLIEISSSSSSSGSSKLLSQTEHGTMSPWKAILPSDINVLCHN